MNRRRFLKTAGTAVAGTVLAPGSLCRAARRQTRQRPSSRDGDDLEQYDFILPRVKFKVKADVPDQWDVRPGGDANLLEELEDVVRCKVKRIHGTDNWQPDRARRGQLNAVVSFDEPEKLKEYPFLFMTGESYYDLSDRQRRNLKDYINQGGFLLMDDCMLDPGGDFFYKSSFKILNEVFGDGAVKKVGNEHEVFHNVFDLSKIGLPYIQAQRHGARGVFIEDRLAVFLSSTDIHCGWCDRAGRMFGNGGRRGDHSYKEAIRMGINIIMYALSH
jgi:hypothetical protein